MTFTPPKQDRSRLSTDAFLDALEACLNTTGMTRTTIEQVAERAQLGRAAFLRRFGSKREAVLVLYDRYANQCVTELDRMRATVDNCAAAEDFLTSLYAATEQMELAHFGLNLAMHQDFADELETAAGTKRVFYAFLGIMEKLQDRFLPPEAKSAEGRFAASQLIITLSLNYTLRAMPGMPRDAGRRHALMGQIAWLALRQPAAPM
jgi:AcrR family transcriptional regulator